MSSWNAIYEFRGKFLSTALVAPALFFFIVLWFVHAKYKRIWFELEADYLFYNYKYLEMPFTEKGGFLDVKMSIDISDSGLRDEFINQCSTRLNEERSFLELHITSYRSFVFLTDNLVRIYDIEDCELNKLKSTIFSFCKEFFPNEFNEDLKIEFSQHIELKIE